MPLHIPFRNGRLDYSGAPAHNSRKIIIQDDVIQAAKAGAANALLPTSYPSADAKQIVSLTSIVLDFSQRLVDYDAGRLISIIRALQSGVNLPALSVATRQNGTYELLNGYHRFLACALLGFHSIPVDQAPSQQQVVPQPVVAKKYVPPHLRNKT